MTALPAAVLFDCDGTLADTETLSQRVWTRVLERRGVTPTPDDFQAVIGHAWPRSYDHFSQRVDLGEPEVFRTEVRAEAAALHATDLRLFPDAVDTIRQLAAAGVPVGVVSSSPRAHVQRCLAHGDLTALVGVVVGADDVARHKPHPEPYLTAARTLGVDPADCTTVEDTVTGITSGREAGTFVVAVARGAVARDALEVADRIVDELTVGAVRRPDGWRAVG